MSKSQTDKKKKPLEPVRIILGLRGIRPLIMHNGRTVDPLDPWSKKLKSLNASKKKTDETYAMIGDVEFEAGLYWDDVMGVYIPSDNWQKMFLDAARRLKMGRDCVGVLIDAPLGTPLRFKNSTNLEALKTDPTMRLRRPVRIGQRKVMRVRPYIPTGWTTEIPVVLDREIIDVAPFIEIVHTAGNLIGIGDWRPGMAGSFGRFVLETVDGEAVT